MPRTLYSPRLSDDVVRALYREGQRRGLPMTRLADELLRQSLGGRAKEEPKPYEQRGRKDPPRSPIATSAPASTAEPATRADAA